MSEPRFTKDDRVTCVNKYFYELDGKSGVIVHSSKFSGRPEYSVQFDDVDFVWVMREDDLEAEDAS